MARANATVVEMIDAAVAKETSELEAERGVLEAELAQQKRDSMAALKKHEEKSNKRMEGLTSKHEAAMAKVLHNYSNAAVQVEQLEKMKQALQAEHQQEQDALQGEIEKEKSARKEVEEKLNKGVDISSIAELLLTKEKYDELKTIQGAASIGKNKKRVSDLSKRRQRDLGRLVGPIIDALLLKAKAGESDPAGVLDAVLARRDSKQTEVGGALLTKIKEHEEKDVAETLEVLAVAYRLHVRARDRQTAKQILSIGVEAGREKKVGELRQLFSSPRRPFKVGGFVRYSGPGNVVYSGRVASTDNESGSVQVAGVRGAFDADKIDAGAIWHAGHVRCTDHQIYKAKKHAKSKSPGAAVPKQINGHSGINEKRSAKVAAFLRDPSVVEPVEASLANSKKGVKWRLKQRRWVLWQRLCKEMEEVKLKPVSWVHFSLLTGTKQYELLTADNCCCGICRELGFDNYDELRDIVRQLDSDLLLATDDVSPLPTKSALLKRITQEEEFRRGSYANHLQAESDCGHHCLKHLLSTKLDGRFRSPCTHGAPASGAGMEPKNMDEQVEEATGGKRKKAAKDDWHDTCEVCQEPQVRGKNQSIAPTAVGSLTSRASSAGCGTCRKKEPIGLALIVCATWMPLSTPAAVPSVAKQIESLASLTLGSAYSSTTSGSEGLLLLLIPAPLPPVPQEPALTQEAAAAAAALV